MQTHYDWMNKDAPEKPEPEKYGAYKDNEGNYKWSSYPLKIQYDADLKDYQNYQRWLENRNPTRHELESKYQFDTKNGMHLVRLMTMGRELLETGNLTLPCPNAKELLEIRHGKYSYEELLNWFEKEKRELEELVPISPLPNRPNHDIINSMMMELRWNYLKGELC
jgi:hypothetical protein